MTDQTNYDRAYPFDPSYRIDDLRGIEKLRAIDDPELRAAVIKVHEAGGFEHKPMKSRASRPDRTFVEGSADFKRASGGDHE